jgi:predicted nucleic acid-binding protein
MAAIDAHRLHDRGIGYADAHLLASALLSDLRLWTRDRRLARVAAELSVSAGLA